MPFALLIIGIVLLVGGVRGKHEELFGLFRDEFAGERSYLKWIVIILVIGMAGYVPTLKPLSRIFLALLIVVLFLSKGQFFDKFNRDVFGVNTNVH